MNPQSPSAGAPPMPAAPDAAGRVRYAYDVFLSHNHADKPWVRTLAGWLADQEYNGRRLRPWLDEHFLDPGTLSGEAELTTAMDRSRLLGLVLSPRSVASAWVDFEVRYFLGRRGADAVVPLLRCECTPPAALKGLPALDFTAAEPSPEGLRRLQARLCPPGPVRMEDVRQGVDQAFEAVAASDPGGLWPDPTPERDALLAELLRHDVDDAASEGFAVAAFVRAAEHVVRLQATGHPGWYNCKMLLGECLAAALLRSTGYRQVAQRLVDAAAADSGEPVLLFVVTRAYSKVAEMDAGRVDAGVLLRIAAELDARDPGSNEVRALEASLARVAGKLRDAPYGELLIKTLAGGGRASRIAAIGGISLSGERDGPVFYLTEVRDRFAARQQPALPAGPPSPRLLGELSGLDLDQHPSVGDALLRGKEDLEIAYPGTGFPYGMLWGIRHEPLDPAGVNNAPFMGTVARATLGNMEALAERTGVTTVVCLTEPRIVDALFDHAGALLLPRQEPDSPQCRRLRDRGIPFAMVDDQTMGALTDGVFVVVDTGKRLGTWKG